MKDRIILKVSNLRKSFQENAGKLVVLDKVDLNVKAGEKIAITGESGSGKSTLLHLMGALDEADEGEILVSGEKITPKRKNIDKFRNKKIGFIFQFHYLLSDFTAEENVAMPQFIATKNLKKSLREARKLLKILDILSRKHHYPNQLSGGEQQRVAVARALINNPKIIFADEPTGNLDAKHSEELLKYIIKLNETRNQTFVIVTHDERIAKRMDQHYKLKDGILIKRS